ncbi:MAG: DNA helicase RecQ, partial [Gemmatimonadaceae bacterium]|nr:DNA helicase RecQ [Gemmatimonadaceae bacterium]
MIASQHTAPRADVSVALDEARATLRRHFGYPDFRPPQVRAVQAVLSGRDALVVLPTGGGEGLVYQGTAALGGGRPDGGCPPLSPLK